MAVSAITAAVDRRHKSGDLAPLDFPMLNDAGTIPAGALVNIDSNGYAVNASDTSGHLACPGIALETKTITTSQADGDETIKVATAGDWIIAHYTGDIAITDIGAVMYVMNNNSVDDVSAASTGSIPVGPIVKWIDADTVVVRLMGLTTTWVTLS